MVQKGTQADQPVGAVRTTFDLIYLTCFPTDYFKTKTITYICYDLFLIVLIHFVSN